MLRSFTPIALAVLALVATDVSAQARLRGTTPPSTSTKPAESSSFGAIIGDGGFESGSPNAAWTEGSTTFGTPLCNAACGLGGGTGPHGGSWWAWFGGTTGAETGFVEQTVTIPSGSATLTYWLEIPTANIPGTLTVSMDGTTLAFYDESDSTTYATYAQVSIPINAFADGAAHDLRFEQQNGAGADVINFFIDDVAIDAVPAGASLNVSPPSVNFGGVQSGSTSTETITLTNNGSALLTISSITVSGAGFTINTGSTDLTLDPAQATTFTATFSPNATGPFAGSVSIASNAPGSPTAVPLSGTGTNFITYASTDTPIAIPDDDPTGITSTITVPGGAPNILDLDVEVNIDHTWVGDLLLTLTHGANSGAIVDRPNFPEAGAGCSANNMNIVVDDEGTDGDINSCAALASADEAYTAGGHYTPDTPLAVFELVSASGVWTLNVSDNVGFDEGSLNSWALLVTPVTVAGENGPEGAVARLAVTPNPIASSAQVALTVGTAQDVRVALYDVLGREVRVLYEGTMAAAQQAYVAFTTAGLPAGTYVVRATGDQLQLTQRVTVTR
jgi:subtilisin-like proprotein convertase family protein